MAKLSQVQKWLAPSVPHKLTVDGPHGETKDFGFQLCLNFNALGLIEKRTGIPLTSPVEIFKQLSVSNIQVLYWAAIQAYHPEYAGDEGLEVVGSLLNFKNSGGAVDAVWEAFLIAVPEATATALREAIANVAAANEGTGTPDPTKTAPATN